MAMELCFTVDGVLHCYWIPLYEFPLSHWKPGPGPVNYPAFIRDVILVASLEAETKKISDESVQKHLLSGYQEALKAMQARAGAGVKIGNL
jgi:hypothetical protein